MHQYYVMVDRIFLVVWVQKESTSHSLTDSIQLFSSQMLSFNFNLTKRPFHLKTNRCFITLKKSSTGTYSGEYGGKNKVTHPSELRKSFHIFEVCIRLLSIKSMISLLQSFKSSSSHFIRFLRWSIKLRLLLFSVRVE